jgi:hypothetical protein
MTVNYKIVDGKRVMDGPFTFKSSGQPLTTISGTYKNGKFEGLFSFTRNGITYGGTTSASAIGNFKNDNLDGLWTFKYEHMSYKITFKEGMLIKAERVDNKKNSLIKISCDDIGLLNGLETYKHKDQYGAIVQEENQWVHGIKVSTKIKDIATGQYLKSTSVIKDTSIYNDKNFEKSTLTFKKANDDKVFKHALVNCESSDYDYNWNATDDNGLGIILKFLQTDFKNPCQLYQIDN